MAVSVADEVRMKVSAARGRLYVTGPSHHLAKAVVGNAYNERREAYEISLTLESLVALRKAAAVTPEEFKTFCTREVIAWVDRAVQAREAVTTAQRKVAEGWRPEGLEWQDHRADTLAPEHLMENERTAPKVWMDKDGDIRWKYRPPHEHQEIMAAVAILLEGSANFSQMGTGKTRALCEVMAYQFRNEEIDVAIVPVPKGVMGTWAREAPVWSDRLRVHRLGFRPGLKVEHSVEKRGQWLRDYAKTMLAASPLERLGQPNVLLINYEVVSALEDELLALTQHMKVGLYPDEMHRLANPNAQVTKTALKLAEQSVKRVGMTGTPQKDKTGEGLWSQMYVVDLGDTFGANVVQFRREWLTENPWTHSYEPKPGALEAMGQRLAIRSVRFLKKDCMDLPEKVPVIKEVELTAAQWKAYEEMKEDLLTELGEDDTRLTEAVASTQMAKIMRLAQITSGYLPTTDGQGSIYRFTPNPKLNALIDLIDAEIDTQQIVVWAYFRADHDLLKEALAKYKPVVIRGGQNSSAHDHAEESFASGASRLLIGQQGAGGVGRNLQAASLAIYYSQQYSLIEREQSEDRTHRGGSEIHDKITYVDLVATGTVDEDVSAGLDEKRSIAEVVVDLKRKLRGW